MSKYLIYPALATILLLSACGKKTAICSRGILYLREHIALQGYDTSVLNKIYIETYSKEQGNLINSKPLVVFESSIGNNKILIKTTAGREGIIDAEYNYKIIIDTDTFIINDIVKGPNSETFEVEGHCSPGASQVTFHPFDHYTINGKIAKPLSTGGLYDYILLVKP